MREIVEIFFVWRKRKKSPVFFLWAYGRKKLKRVREAATGDPVCTKIVRKLKTKNSPNPFCRKEKNRMLHNGICIYAGGDYCTEPKTAGSKGNRNSRLCNRVPRPPLEDMQCYQLAFFPILKAMSWLSIQKCIEITLNGMRDCFNFFTYWNFYHQQKPDKKIKARATFQVSRNVNKIFLQAQFPFKFFC